MVESQTTTRADAIKTAGDIARTSAENLVKEAVAEAMREVEIEEQSSGSRGRIPAALLLLAIGALVGYALATRSGSETFESTGLGRPSEPSPAETGSTGTTGTGSQTATEDDEETVDAPTDG